MPPLLMTDQKHHFPPVGAEVYFPVAEALSFKDGHPHPPVLLPGEGVDGGGGVGLGHGEEGVDVHPEGLRHGGEEGDVGAGELALPLGHGLGGDPQTVGEQFLGQSRSAAERGNILPQSGKIVFHGKDSFQRCYGKQAASFILYHTGRGFGKQPLVVFFVFIIYFGKTKAHP